MKRSFSIIVLCFCALLLSTPKFAWAVKFGKVSVDSDPLYEMSENTRRGYAGYLFVVKNNDKKPHTVRVKIPTSFYSPRVNGLTSCTRTCKLAAGQTTHLWLYQPAINIFGSNALVSIDGVSYPDHAIPLDFRHEALCNDTAAYSAGGYATPTAYPSVVPAPAEVEPPPLPQEETTEPDSNDEAADDEAAEEEATEEEATEEEATEETADEKTDKKADDAKTEEDTADQPDTADKTETVTEQESDEAESRALGTASPYATPGTSSVPFNDATIMVLFARGVSGNVRDQIDKSLVDSHAILSTKRVAEWPTNWIAYSQFDGVILTDSEFTTLPPEVVNALADYVSTGGVVWVRPVKKTRTATTPSLKKLQQAAANGMGTFLTSRRDTRSFKEQTVKRIQCFNNWKSAAESADLLPALERNAMPVRLILVLLIFYALLIGPGLQFFLKRKRRRIWMLWIIPLTSIALCVVVFIGSYLSEGFRGFASFRNITVLDQTSGRASTVGWASFYSPLSDGDGLRFSTVTVLQPQWSSEQWRNDDYHEVAMDWTSDQHLTTGWLQAKTPIVFRLWKAEQRREKITIRKDDSGQLVATNALGADAEGLTLHMPDDKWYTVEKLPAGETHPLQPLTAPPIASSMPTVKEFCQNAFNWRLPDCDDAKKHRARLTPGTYQVMVDGHPFVNTAITNPVQDQGKTLIFGRFVVEK